MSMNDTYLGDGLYASDDGYRIRLRVPRECGNDEVFLNPEVLQSFIVFLEKSRGIEVIINRLGDQKGDL